MSRAFFIVVVALGFLAAFALLVLLLPPKQENGASQAKDFADCVARGYPVMESAPVGGQAYPRQCNAGGRIFSESIPEIPAEVQVEYPEPDALVRSPLVAEGKALGTWFFEANLPAAIFDANGKELGRAGFTAQAEWMTTGSVPWSGKIPFETSTTATGIFRVMRDNPSGLPEYDRHFDVPVRFAAPGDTMAVKVFFGNSTKDPQAEDCSRVFPAERIAPKSPAVARAALDELLRGPTAAEKRSGYFTSINAGVSVLKLTIENQTARVDFDEALERAIGGSCRVTAIRAQITETLKQFPNVRDVVISVNGRTEDILQP